MNREKAGRVTFMPLNRLKSATVQYPKADDAVPLLSKITYDRQYVMAFEQIFARTIVCEDLAVAAQYTRSHGLNAVTLEGDRADRRGALSGGYHDVRRSRFDAIKQVKRWREAYERDNSRLTEVKAGLQKLEQEITRSAGEIQRLDAKKRQILDSRAMLASQIQWTAKEEEAARQRVTKLENDLEEAQKELRDATAKRTSYEEEKRSPMRQNLSAEEQQSLQTLTRQSEEQKQALLTATQERQQVSSQERTILASQLIHPRRCLSGTSSTLS